MLDEKSLFILENSLRRIFAIKITRSTFRELQNLILSLSQGNQAIAQELFESLMKGEPSPTLLSNAKLKDHFASITREFTILIHLTKDVFERGEFVNIITSDTINGEEGPAFLNRIRRVDGEEFLFITDPKSTMHVIQHFQARLHELEKTPEGKKHLQSIKKDLLALSAKIQQLAN